MSMCLPWQLWTRLQAIAQSEPDPAYVFYEGIEGGGLGPRGVFTLPLPQTS